MREVNIVQHIALPPAHFWALRADTNFDRFVADAENCTFELLSMAHGTDAATGLPTIAMETELTAEESPLPAALQALMGAKKFCLLSRSRWLPGRYDSAAHKATFETNPKVMSSRVTLKGESHLEPVAGQPDACTVTYRIEIHVKILALSSLLEQGLEKRIRDSYSRLPELTKAYCKTDACKAFFVSQQLPLPSASGGAPAGAPVASAPRPCANAASTAPPPSSRPPPVRTARDDSDDSRVSSRMATPTKKVSSIGAAGAGRQ